MIDSVASGSLKSDRISCDVAIVGGGVLGVSLYFWLTRQEKLKVFLVEKGSNVGQQTTTRNTGVIHSPFYLDPEKRHTQASSALISRNMWKELAMSAGIPWNECGTIEVAYEEEYLPAIDKYRKWAIENGMKEAEFEVLSGEQVSELENDVHCAGAFFSKSDVSTDFGALTSALSERAGNGPSRILFGSRLRRAAEDGQGVSMAIDTPEGEKTVHADFMVNASGGSALDLAHNMGYAGKYAEFFFRGEYWRVNPAFATRIKRNIYSVPRHQGYPFLDPHFIVRSSGIREIGPNAVLVSGPEAYSRSQSGTDSLIANLMKRPLGPKIRLAFNAEFLSLVSAEWKSSLYRSEMAARVRKFIPALDESYLTVRGISGVRSSMVDSHGFVPDAKVVFGESSLHILNYNSPGASGAPAYAAHMVGQLLHRGVVSSHEAFSPSISKEWDYYGVSGAME